jgi:enoyl-CoA hydratase/carnithine racemase
MEGSSPQLSSYSTLLVERNGPVGWLIFNRPAARNSMNAVMLDELEEAWRELNEDPAVRVIVNTGEGDAFQTGLDVVQLSRDPDALRTQSGRTRRAELRLTGWHNDVWKPVITAVNGICAGGGLHFVADADIVMASSSASFLDTHVSVGQVAAFELIGLARRMPFEAVLRMALEQGLTDACKAGAAELVSMWGHPDQTEGPLAFAEKREPEWSSPSGERSRKT